MTTGPQTETIAAPATATGQGGIGVIRMSGPATRSILARIFQPAAPGFSGFRPWTLYRGRILAVSGTLLDDGLAVFMPGPRSFTGEDVAELHCHGSPALLGLVLENLCMAGARLAERGEFTRRAFLNGRMDLTQAEAVAELIAAPGPEAARWAALRLEGRLGRQIAALRDQVDDLRALICLAVDFPDDEIDAALTPEAFAAQAAHILAAFTGLITACERTRHWRDGLTLALAGPVNAGKSSLLNLLLGRERALVSATPGTTRDYLEENIRLGNLPVRLVDTAGLRSEADAVEADGIRLGRRVIEQADGILLLIDGAQPDALLTAALLRELGPQRIILVWNKQDLGPPPAWLNEPPYASVPQVALSARSGHGVENLEQAVRSLALRQAAGEPEAEALVPNLRQTEALRLARAELEALCADVQAAVPWDLCAVRLDSVAAALEEVTGQSTPDEVLNRIFSAFCIGK